MISIHALLAESDPCQPGAAGRHGGFLSTLSLRRATIQGLRQCARQNKDFYPRSPCGERPESQLHRQHPFSYFYPRSPCGERQNWHL